MLKPVARRILSLVWTAGVIALVVFNGGVSELTSRPSLMGAALLATAFGIFNTLLLTNERVRRKVIASEDVFQQRRSRVFASVAVAAVICVACLWKLFKLP